MKKNGFTLAELLMTISILGILVIVVLNSANKLITTRNQEYYDKSEKMMVLSAKIYFTDYRSKLPKIIDNKNQVLLRELVEKKYMDEVLDVQKKLCDLDKSYVEVVKVSETDYQYRAYLNCPETKYETEIN